MFVGPIDLKMYVLKHLICDVQNKRIHTLEFKKKKIIILCGNMQVKIKRNVLI